MHLKHGAKITGMSAEMVLALVIANTLYNEERNALTLISGVEGQHARGSSHYIGQACDLRVPTNSDGLALAARLAARLGEDYDVVFEGGHIHIAFQPKHGVNDGGT